MNAQPAATVDLVDDDGNVLGTLTLPASIVYTPAAPVATDPAPAAPTPAPAPAEPVSPPPASDASPASTSEEADDSSPPATSEPAAVTDAAGPPFDPAPGNDPAPAAGPSPDVAAAQSAVDKAREDYDALVRAGEGMLDSSGATVTRGRLQAAFDALNAAKADLNKLVF